MLEVPWRASGSGFYHGLILYASAFVHVKRDNAHGIAAQLRKAEDALRPYEPAYLGIDVRRIRRDAAALRRLVEADAPSSPPSGKPWRDRIDFPRIHLDPDRLLGSEPELDDGD